MMTILAAWISLNCLVAFIWTGTTIWKEIKTPRVFYLIWKNLVTAMLGGLYLTIFIDQFIDIVDYPVVESSLTMQVLRLSAFLMSLVLIGDSYMRRHWR
jgi:hypothetical protein